jgi:hypothetical protein
MSVNLSHGTVLIREDTFLPVDLAFNTQAFLPGWKIVSGIDGRGLARKLEEAHWNFFFLASETKATVFGRDKPGVLCRAVKQILAKRKGPNCNSLEIIRVDSKRFFGIPFLSVAANSRHIQESLYLAPFRKTAAKMPATTTSKDRLGERAAVACGSKHETRTMPLSNLKSSTEIRK